MEKIKKTATNLYNLSQTIAYGLLVMSIIFALFTGLPLLRWLLNWESDAISTGAHSLEIGFLKLQIADAYVPDNWTTRLQSIITFASAFVYCMLGFKIVRCISAILDPISDGQPFRNTVSVNLKKLSIWIIVLGVAINCVNLTEQIILVTAYDLPSLLISEKITRATIDYTFDLSFMIYSAILMLLSYVFRYGTQLQELSDETL